MYKLICISLKERKKIIDKLKHNSIIMEFQKIANLLDSASNQPSKFRTRNCIEINDESRRTYASNDIAFKIKC